MRIFSIIILLVLLCSRVTAQDKFAAGYYLTNTGDTVQGYIQYKVNYVNGFKFRPNLKARTQDITIDQVESFEFSSGTAYARVAYLGTSKLPPQPIFIRKIVQGQVDLFYYMGGLFIGSEDRGRFAISKKRSSSTGEALKNYQDNVGAFNILFQDCAKVKDEAQKTSISEESLTDLLRSYHECVGVQQKEFKTKKVKRMFHWGLFAGQSFSNLSFGKSSGLTEANYLYNSSFKTSSYPTIGVMALIGSRSPFSSLSFQTSLAYRQADHQATWTFSADDFDGYDIEQTSTTHVEYKLLSITAGLQISARSNTLNPYLGFGFAAQQFLSLNEGVHQITTINAGTEEEKFELGMAKSSFGVYGTAGIKKRISGDKALFFEGNFENGYVSINDPAIARMIALSLRIGFMF